MQFEFASAARIIFGDGSAAQLPQLAREKGRHALLVTDSFEPPAVSDIIRSLRDADSCHSRISRSAANRLSR